MSNVSLRQASAHERRNRIETMQESLLARQRKKTSDLESIKSLITSDNTWYLLICVPMGLAAYLMNLSSGTIFVINFLGMIPLARILGDSTEEVAAGLKNETAGGLLNATFGNAVEMIFTVQTLRNRLVAVAKGALLGSILSNLLLVLGMSFFFGGIGRRGKEQEFKESGPLVSMTMLLLAVLAFSVPTIMALSPLQTPEPILQISRMSAVLILISYCAYLVYQLYTHNGDFQDKECCGEEDGTSSTMNIRASTSLLFLTTVLVATCSECVVGCIEGVVAEWGVSQAFIGVVLLPVIGNACEHVSAIRMSLHEKPILAIGIAVGSSCQIALFVIPLSVLLGWIMGIQVDLDYQILNVVILALAVIIVTVILVDGKSTWIEGFMLQITYLVVATAYWYS
jgi:Ca2+:H+ antiporter